MIDTIVVRIHDLKANEGLVTYLYQVGLKGKETKLREVAEYSPEKEVTFRRYYVDYDTGRSYTQGYNAHLKSYNYDVSYYINFNLDYIEFAFSMPKYLYGNNLMQSVPHLYDNYFTDYKNNKYHSINQLHFNYLKKSLRYFLEKSFMEVVPKDYEVEIVQVDLAFNLFFKDKRDLDFYLSYLRTIRKKSARESSSHTTSYQDSMHFKGSHHTLKIYNKGIEFKVHDYKKIKKRFGAQMANEISRISNNVLRMEVSFKKRGMSYVFMNYLAPPSYRDAYKAYKNYNKNGQFTYQGNLYKVGDMVPKGVKILLKDGKKLNGRLVSFFISLDDYTNEEKYEFKEVFTFQLYSRLVKRFTEITSQFHLGKWRDFEFLKSQLAVKNYDLKLMNRTKLSEKTVKMIIELLRTKSWSQIISGGYLARATAYKYKKFFKDQGLQEVNTDMHTSAVDFTYSSYYEAVIPSLKIISSCIRLPFNL